MGRKMRIVWIAIAEKGLKQKACCWSIEQGAIPANAALDHNCRRHDVIERLMEVCDEVWLFGQPDRFTEEELEVARRLKKPIRNFAIGEGGVRLR